MHRGRSLDVIVSAEIVRAPWTRLVEPERYAVAAVVAEMIDAFCEPDLALPDVYELLTGASPRSPRRPRRARCCRASRCGCSRCWAWRRRSTACVRCGAPLGAGRGLARRGGRRLHRCGLPRALARSSRAGRARIWRTCARSRRAKGSGAAPPCDATPRAAAAVEELVAHHLGRRPKALAHSRVFGA